MLMSQRASKMDLCGFSGGMALQLKTPEWGFHTLHIFTDTCDE